MSIDKDKTLLVNLGSSGELCAKGYRIALDGKEENLMLFTPQKNKLSQMRFEGQQANGPRTTHISELGAVCMPTGRNSTAESCDTAPAATRWV